MSGGLKNTITSVTILTSKYLTMMMIRSTFLSLQTKVSSPRLSRTAPAPAPTTWAYEGGRSSSSSPCAAASQPEPSSASPRPGFPPPSMFAQGEKSIPVSDPPPARKRSSRALLLFLRESIREPSKERKMLNKVKLELSKESTKEVNDEQDECPTEEK